MWALIENGLEHNGLITAFAFVGVIMWVSVILSKRLTFGAFMARRLPSSSVWCWPGSAAP